MTDATPTTADEVELPDLAALRAVLLTTLGDDELVSGHRHSHWTGVAPSLEEDLAFSTIAQDEINHADVWYSVLVGQDRAAIDRLGLGRQPDEYRHAVLCERPPRDFAYTLARHWLYDHFDAIRLGSLADSTDADVAAVAIKLLHEERYHLEHADHWLWRLANTNEESLGHLRDGLAQALPEALWLFEPLPHEESMVAEGLLAGYTASLLQRWLEIVLPMLEDADLSDVVPGDVASIEEGGWQLPHGFFAEPGGRHGRHTPDFTDDVWPEMTELYRAHPGATW